MENMPTMRKAFLVDEENFKHDIDGESVKLFLLRNRQGVMAQITNFGARLVSLFVPDRNGKYDDVVLGYDNIEAYRQDPYFMGAMVGRYANRIGFGRFQLFGKEYQLEINDAPNHLHGGRTGLHKKVWHAQLLGENQLQLSCLSPDGEDGYPGNLAVKMLYTLTEENELKIDFAARTDRPTVVNLSHHSYFNLAGAGEGEILGHRIRINAHSYTPITRDFLPNGEIMPVAGTPFDFRQGAFIGENLCIDDEQLHIGNGFDHNFVLQIGRQKRVEAAEILEPNSGRMMKIFTTQPGLQFYSGNNLDGNVKGKQGKEYSSRSGFCLETQHFPDSPNKPHFPMTVLLPNQLYRHQVIYAFSVQDGAGTDW